jgi:hypothetical protein
MGGQRIDNLFFEGFFSPFGGLLFYYPVSCHLFSPKMIAS